MAEKDSEKANLIRDIETLQQQVADLQAAQTRLIQAEEAASKSQQRLGGILEIAEDAIISIDKEHHITLFNQGAERIFQYTTAEVMGQPIDILLPSRYRAAHHHHVQEFATAAERSRRMGERRVISGLRKDGTEFPAEASISRLDLSTGPVFTVILQDVSDRHQIEYMLEQARDQALESSRLKSEFLANMSHEIRTPMNGIIGMTDLLLRTPLDDVQQEYATVIKDSANSLLTIINDILDFSKIEAGKLQLEIVDLDVLQVVESVAELLTSAAREKQLTLLSFVPPDMPPLRGDPVRLRQAILNLGSNAVKFTAEGEVVLWASLEGEDQDRLQVRFTVRDTGIGLSEGARRRLFQPFVQADGSTTRTHGGSGLGLVITKQLVELMGGAMGVDSEVGRGSSFWFVLPLEKRSSGAPVQTPSPLPDLSNVRVLVVDDHATSREILVKYLDSWDMDNAAVTGSREALQQLRLSETEGRPYDVAIIDLRMPEINGLELAQHLRSHPATREMKLILLTAFDTRGQGQTALRSGFDAYLTKPVKQSQLFDCLVGVIHQRETGREVPSTLVGMAESSAKDELQQVQLVLLAEDNPVNQKVVVLQLERMGCRVDTVTNGEEAVTAAADTAYDLILMDCQMPRMDGFAASRAIRKAESVTGRRVPIVALTANAMQGDRERCIAAGMDDYLSKPVTLEKLQAGISGWLVRDESAPQGSGDSDSDSSSTPDLTPIGAKELLDLDALQASLGDDPETARNLLGLFRDTTAGLVQKLTAAAEEQNIETMADLAHQLKGSAGMVGAHELAKYSKALEQAALERNWSAIHPTLAQLQQIFGQTTERIKGILDPPA